MRKFTMNNKKIPLHNAVYSGFHNKLCAKRGDGVLFRLWNGGPITIGKIIGRIDTCDNDGEDCRGWAVVLVLSEDASHCYLRRVAPHDITACFTLPQKVPAFFFGGKLPDNATLIRLLDNGSISELYIDQQIPL